jgi:hypothetical protein
LVKIIPGHRDSLEQQLVDAVFSGDTDQAKAIQQRLTRKANLTVIESSDLIPDEPESPHQSDVKPT